MFHGVDIPIGTILKGEVVTWENRIALSKTKVLSPFQYSHMQKHVQTVEQWQGNYYVSLNQTWQILLKTQAFMLCSLLPLDWVLSMLQY